jgi:uncharacterized protein involved in cysteine biosynthesis
MGTIIASAMPETKKGAFSRFAKGAGYFGKGFSFVLGNRALWPWVIAPTLLTGALTIGGSYAAYRWAQRFIDAHTAGHGAIITAILTFLLFIFVAGVAYVAFLATSLLATAPFAGILSEKTEKLKAGEAPAPKGFVANVREGVRSTVHTLVSVSIYLCIAVVLFALQFFIAPLAPFVWVASLFITGTFLAYDAFDLPLSRRNASFGDKWGYVGTHTAEALGFGVVVALLLFIPGFGLVVPAVAAVGGTLLYLDIPRD